MSKKHKIGFVGANFTTKHLQNELVKRCRVFVYSHALPQEPFSKEIIFRRVELPWELIRKILRKRGSQLTLPCYYRKLLKHLWTDSPDTVVVLDFFRLWTIQAIIYKVFHPKIKIVIHTETKRAPAFLPSRLFFYMMVVIMRLSGNKIHSYITYSKAGTSYIKKLFPDKRVDHLVLPIDENTPLYQEPTPGKEIRVLMPARFVAFKRHIDVIKAVEELPESSLIRIDFASFTHDSAPERKKIETLLKFSKSNNKIKIIQPIDSPFSNYYVILKNYDTIILPSENEGLGAVVPAALHCGRPAIISNTVPASMYMSESQRHLIFNVGDVQALSKIFLSLHKQDLSRDGQNASKYIRSQFSAEKCVEKFLRLIN